MAGREHAGMEVEGAAAREHVPRGSSLELEEGAARRNVDGGAVVCDGSLERVKSRGASGWRTDDEPLVGSESEAIARRSGDESVGFGERGDR
jgi:hypothetical protein